MLSFSDWTKLTESFAFDTGARYADKTFGLDVGKIDSGKVAAGGLGGDWGGSMQRALAFARVANEYMGKNIISSQKRSKRLTARTKAVSDHYSGNESSYAVDLAVQGKKGDELLAHLMKWCGHPEYVGGKWFNFTEGGYRYQVGWRVPDHFDHIHVGVKKAGASTQTSNTMDPIVNNTLPGKTPGEKILNNQIILNWLFTMMPDIAATITPQSLDKNFADHPEDFKWFKNKFGLTDSGDPGGSPRLNSTQSEVDRTAYAVTGNSKISSAYAGEAAQNINLIIDELEKNGVTNEYAIVGILSTIGKESGFIPKNEIPYTNTKNSRIRTIFGKRVADLNDEELTRLKKDPAAFWDRVYGPNDPTGASQRYGNTSIGDGSRYLGRGFNGITFKSAYKKYSDLIGVDLVSNPELLNSPKVAAKAAVAYFLNGFNAIGVDPNMLNGIDSAIEKCVQINAGLGVNVKDSETLAKAKEVSKKFDIA